MKFVFISLVLISLAVLSGLAGTLLAQYAMQINAYNIMFNILAVGSVVVMVLALALTNKS